MTTAFWVLDEEHYSSIWITVQLDEEHTVQLNKFISVHNTRNYIILLP